MKKRIKKKIKKRATKLICTPKVNKKTEKIH